ncbi:hypothetical protein ACTHPH_13525 [Paenibacillus pasadenensis]|uniref:Uncharacterized protein n=1 Tax=Paenibacillus pasadenensis TaxID=217090 RepID=A0A2N5N5L9_9BACL|nr:MULTISPECIES: hypothetical protein [Paenibacillus]PLT45625.1 hypothetical protein B8V81_4056 [Paenibacillus pasadenensis]QGG56074.1 hypothetical protein GE073_11140 [Paenibacillus sp. B01]
MKRLDAPTAWLAAAAAALLAAAVLAQAGLHALGRHPGFSVWRADEGERLGQLICDRALTVLHPSVDCDIIDGQAKPAFLLILDD